MDESLYREVSQSLKAVFDLTARVDERLKMLAEKQAANERRQEQQTQLLNDLTTKVGILETKNGSEVKRAVEGIQEQLMKVEMRLQAVEKTAAGSEHKWKMIFDFIYKTVWVIIVCYLLVKLNLQAPPLP